MSWDIETLTLGKCKGMIWVNKSEDTVKENEQDG